MLQLNSIPNEITAHKVLFISGIDTNVGKTYATAALALALQQAGHNVITQKMIQTGCTGSSEDIEKHRELMGLPLLEIDKSGLTCPVILSYPASPHLAAEIDHAEIQLDRIEAATRELSQMYDMVLLEGAGGLMVPIHATGNETPLGGFLTIDYIARQQYPVVLVTSGKLGSLNHTLLSLDACLRRGIETVMIIYNLYPNDDAVITRSSLAYLKQLGIPVAVLQQM